MQFRFNANVNQCFPSSLLELYVLHVFKMYYYITKKILLLQQDPGFDTLGIKKLSL